MEKWVGYTLDASAQKIKLTANDMELGIETIIEGDILEKGIVAIDAEFFPVQSLSSHRSFPLTPDCGWKPCVRPEKRP